jgi:hypothetical protein
MLGWLIASTVQSTAAIVVYVVLAYVILWLLAALWRLREG